MARAFADPAVRDDRRFAVDSGLRIKASELVDGFERAVLVHGLAPRDVLRSRDAPRADRKLLDAGRRENLSVVLIRRTHVDQDPGLLLLHDLEDVDQARAEGEVRILRLERAGGGSREVGVNGPLLELPLLPPAVHQLDVRVAVDREDPVAPA